MKIIINSFNIFLKNKLNFFLIIKKYFNHKLKFYLQNFQFHHLLYFVILYVNN